MPDLEHRIRDALDRLGERPDPALILDHVQRRKQHLRLMRQVRIVVLVVAVLVGGAGGMYGLSRAFGIGVPRSVPGGQTIRPHPSPVPSRAPSPLPRPSSSGPSEARSPSPSPSPAAPPPSASSPGASSPSASSTPATPLCADRTAAVAVASQEGAAGTIRTVWRATNTAQEPCHSFAYPGMDFHASSGWLNVQVHRGGFPDIDQPPSRVVLAPGQSLYFVSYWSDVTTGSGPCEQFDRVKVTLPDNFVSAEVASSGCVDPLSVDVGPVTTTPPA